MEDAAAVCTDGAQGAHEIQSYCLGHEAFVTCAAFVQGDGGAVALVTASGDGSVRCAGCHRLGFWSQLSQTGVPNTRAVR